MLQASQGIFFETFDLVWFCWLVVCLFRSLCSTAAAVGGSCSFLLLLLYVLPEEKRVTVATEYTNFLCLPFTYCVAVTAEFLSWICRLSHRHIQSHQPGRLLNSVAIKFRIDTLLQMGLLLQFASFLFLLLPLLLSSIADNGLEEVDGNRAILRNLVVL